VNIGVWQGATMDSLKFLMGPLCPTLLHPGAGGQPAAVFYPFRYPTPYAYGYECESVGDFPPGEEQIIIVTFVAAKKAATKPVWQGVSKGAMFCLWNRKKYTGQKLCPDSSLIDQII
jgi:hypothetical protein